MELVFPKGYYHTHCRNNDHLNFIRRTQNTTRKRKPEGLQLAKTQRVRLIDEFDDFQEYMRSFSRLTQTEKGTGRSVVTQQRKVRSKTTHRHFNKQRNEPNAEIIKPFFPFFKCKIEFKKQTPGKTDFKINNHKFRIKYQFVEQNMGKGHNESTQK